MNSTCLIDLPITVSWRRAGADAFDLRAGDADRPSIGRGSGGWSARPAPHPGRPDARSVALVTDGWRSAAAVD